MRTILMSFKPEWAQKILNGTKTYEVRKHALKTGDVVYGYVSWHSLLTKTNLGQYITLRGTKEAIAYGVPYLNGLVPFRFVVGEVEKTTHIIKWQYPSSTFVFKESCVSIPDLIKYANGKPIYFHEITNLEIFDKPMALGDFYREEYAMDGNGGWMPCSQPVSKAPQSYMFVEVKKWIVSIPTSTPRTTSRS